MAAEAESEPSAAPFSEKRAEYVLEQVKALRTESQARLAAQISLVGIVVTGAAAVSTLALFKGLDTADDGGRLTLLLIVPLLVNGLGFFFVWQNVVRSQIDAYARELGSQFGVSEEHSWFGYQRKAHWSRQTFHVSVIVVATLAVFTTFDAGALYLVRATISAAAEDKQALEILWWVDFAFSVALILAAVTVTVGFGADIREWVIPRSCLTHLATPLRWCWRRLRRSDQSR